MPISDTDLIEQFEDMSLPVTEINHLSHLRIAWLYLRDMHIDEAIEKVTKGTRAFAEHHGDYEKYHHTVTEACVRIMKQRMAEQGEMNFDDFIHRNTDLVDDLKSLLQQYYSEELLWSQQAKSNYLEPDRRRIAWS